MATSVWIWIVVINISTVRTFVIPPEHVELAVSDYEALSVTITVEVLMFGSYEAGDLDPKALNKLIGNQCLGPFYCTLGTGSCKP